MSTLVPAAASNYVPEDDEDDDDWDEKLTPIQWVLDYVFIPLLLTFASALLVLGIVASMWATVKVSAAIIAMIG